MALVIALAAIAVILIVFLGIGIDTLIAHHAVDVAKSNTEAIIRDAQRAAQGRSKSLCGALKDLAITPAAHKLHPIFEHVYNTTQCSKITGKLPAFHR